MRQTELTCTPAMALVGPEGTLTPLGAAAYAAADWWRRMLVAEPGTAALHSVAVEHLGAIVLYQCPGVLDALIDADRACDEAV